MEINEFLGKLEGVAEDGKGGWMACCPAHDDNNPSMHVNVGDDGRILVKCFAGCSLDDIIAAMGLKKRDLMVRDRQGQSPAIKSRGKRTSAGDSAAASRASGRKRDFGKLVCEYVYQNETGETVFKIQRRVMANGKKTFIQMSPDPNDPTKWVFGVEKQGVAYVPYRLPLIRKAAEKNVPVVIVEGEKDVENVIRHLNMVATCNPKGAGKWQAGWGVYFKGVPSVLIIADKDPMWKKNRNTGKDELFAVGQRHACDVERKLRADGYEGRIRKVCLPDVGEAHVKDFTDWIEAMDAAGREVGKSALKEAIDAFGEWPAEWAFDGAALEDINKQQRDAVASADRQAAGSDEAVTTVDWIERGRYGSPCPRSPVGGARLYEVDFDIKSDLKAVMSVGVDSFQFAAWHLKEASDNRRSWVELKTFPAVKCEVGLMVGFAIGCINKVALNKAEIKAAHISELTCKIVTAWMRARGRFFADEASPMYETSMYFNEADGMLYSLHGSEFQSFLASVSNLNRENKTFKMLMSVIDDLTMDAELTPRVRPSKQWARKGDAVYLSNGDSRVYRVTAGKVESVQNGTDGVLFLRGETFAPWTLKDGGGLDPFAHATVFRTAEWGDCHSCMNIRLWYLNLFACHANKPILLLEGPAGCGKTTLARMIKRILAPRSEGLPDTNVNQVNAQDKGAEDFWVIIDNGRLEVFDNLDSKVKWANDNLQTAATNGSHKVRELYKTKKVAILYANSSIIITSNNPIFATDGGGLPDRIIQGHLKSGRKVSLDNELLQDIDSRRDEYLTWTARTLAAALADTGAVEDSINRRHPDYGIFSVRCARVLGCELEAVASMSAAEIDKSVLPIVNHGIAKEIYNVLMAQDPKGRMKFTASEMAAAILARLGEDETDDKTKSIYSARKVGKALDTFKKEFGVIFRMRDRRILDGKSLYETDGLTPQGEAVVAASSGLSGFNSPFSEKSLGSGDLQGFSENTPINPLDPLHAHAQTSDIPSLREEKDIGDNWGFDL